MPVLLVKGPAIDHTARAHLARTLTHALLLTHDVPPDKVQLFYRTARGALTISVHLVGSPRANRGPLVQAIRRAALQLPRIRRVRVAVNAYPADHTAKAGELRAPR